MFFQQYVDEAVLTEGDALHRISVLVRPVIKAESATNVSFTFKHNS